MMSAPDDDDHKSAGGPTRSSAERDAESNQSAGVPTRSSGEGDAESNQSAGVPTRSSAKGDAESNKSAGGPTRSSAEGDAESINQPIDALDALYEDLALYASEHGTATPKDKAWAEQMRARTMDKLAAMRRNLVPDVKPIQARPIRPSLLAMTRDALLARFDEISRRMGGAVQVAHRHFKDLSDDDLRRVLETLETAPE